MIAPTCLLAMILAGQAATGPGPAADTPADRLARMKTAAGRYRFERDDGPIAVGSEPAFRMGQQAGNVLDGAIFLWTDKRGRPEVAAQVFLFRDAAAPGGAKWLHEFTSLSTAPLAADQGGPTLWAPDAAGVAFRPIPGAPKPADTAAARLRQMRALAGEFKAEDDLDSKDRYTPLRLLTTPVARYGARGGPGPEDGAMFAFVEGTDPEVFLFVEARPGAGGGLEWQFACAPMSCWPLRVEHGGKLAWDVPRRYSDARSRPFFCLDEPAEGAR